MRRPNFLLVRLMSCTVPHRIMQILTSFGAYMSYAVHIYESRTKADAKQREGTMTDGHWREQLELSKENCLE